MPARSTQEAFLEKAHAVHGNRYLYDHVSYVNNATKVLVTCRSHGDFSVTPHNHLKGKGCPKCAGNQKMTQEEFIQRATLVHNGRYDYSQTVYRKHTEKVMIICPEHGLFDQEANSHLQGHGCPKCPCFRDVPEDMKKENYRRRQDVRTRTMRERYGVTNPMQLKSSRDKLLATKAQRHTFHTSKSEEMLYEVLKEQFGAGDVKRQYVSEVYPFACDFYIPSRDLYIELNGTWTHGQHWFSEINKRDVRTIAEWAGRTDYYDSAVRTWTVRDVRTRNIAMEHRLNYIVFWERKLRDVELWMALGCPDGQDWDTEYSWI